MKKRFLSLLLCLVLVLGLLPTVAFAAEDDPAVKAIQLGTDGIAKYNTVYFGSYETTNVPWYALNTDGFMLSRYTIGTSQFRNDYGLYNYSIKEEKVSSSLLKDAMDGLYAGETTLFTAQELAAIRETTLSSSSMFPGEEYSYVPDVNAHLFPLSDIEVSNLDGNAILRAKSITAPENGTKWWLRTVFESTGAAAIVVHEEGNILAAPDIGGITSNYGIRPAFNLDLNSVLFTSAAEGGKAASGMERDLTAVEDYDGSEWKLTLLDNSRTFNAATTAYDAVSKTVTVAYSGATPKSSTAPNEYISAIIKDGSGSITHYGRVAQPESADGTLQINLSGIDMTGKTLSVFSEQYNGDYKTDYASSLVEVSPTKNAYAITNTLTNITSSDPSSYRLASETGEYTATLTASDGYLLPATITVTVGDTALTAGTDYTYDSTSGELTIPAVSITGDIAIEAAGMETQDAPAKPELNSSTKNSITLKEIPANTNGAKAQYRMGDGEWQDSPAFTGLSSATEYSFTARYAETDGYAASPASEAATFRTDSGSGGGGGSSTYTVAVIDSKNGTVTADRRTASYGTTVTLTVQPDQGWTLETLTAVTASGKEVDLSIVKVGEKYTFTMPSSQVTVEATFMEDNTILNYFADVPTNSYYYEAVLWAVEQGITQGTDDSHFSPDSVCTRAQAVTFLWRAAGSPAPKTTTMPFTDVPAGSYYYDAVLWAVENGITKGTTDTTFSPSMNCSRAQIVTFLYRSEQLKGNGMDGAWMFQNPFTDVDTESYYGEAVMWAIANGVTEGTASTTFSPDANCTRAQIVTFLWRCMK